METETDNMDIKNTIKPEKQVNKVLLLGIAIIAIVVVVAAVLMLAGDKENSIEMTGEEYAKSHFAYRETMLTDNPDFPGVEKGDAIKITDDIYSMNYDSETGVTWIVLNGFEEDYWLDDGYGFKGDLTETYQVDDSVTITFHITTITMQGITGEIIEELSGVSSAPGGIDPGVIEKA